MLLLVILQNQYRKGGETAPHDTWLYRLWQSHTGKRLREMLPDDIDIEVINASPQIGDTSASYYPPDIQHIAEMVMLHHPDIILACGKAAQTGVAALQLPHIAAPHPAWRQLSKDMTNMIQLKLIKHLGDIRHGNPKK